jgi:LysR family glycine cleavage system transcriptional activator
MTKYAIPSTQTLRAFESAVRHQSYSRAAQELGLTHGAISQRIRELENRQGQRLFLRTGHAMVPTRAAVLMVTQVRSALNLLDHALKTPERRSRTLRLSVLPSFASCWLLPRLSDFFNLHPDIEIEVDSTTRLAGRDESIDVAIRYGPGTWPGVHAKRICVEHLSVVCAPTYRDVHRICDLGDLRSLTLIRNRWQSWTPWLKAANLLDLVPSGPMYLDSGLVLQAAALGQGVALGRGLLMHDAIASGTLVRMFDLEVQDVYAWYVVNLLPSNIDAEIFEAWLVSRMPS